MIRKLNYFGELYIDENDCVIVKTKNGNMFLLDDVTDLTSVEAKDMLLGPKIRDDDEEEEDSNVTKKMNMKPVVRRKEMLNKWKILEDEEYNTKQMKWSKP